MTPGLSNLIRELDVIESRCFTHAFPGAITHADVLQRLIASEPSHSDSVRALVDRLANALRSHDTFIAQAASADLRSQLRVAANRAAATQVRH